MQSGQRRAMESTGVQNRAVVRTRSFNTQRVVSNNVSKHLACWFRCVSVQPGLQNRAVARTRSFNTQRVVSNNVSKHLACWFRCVSVQPGLQNRAVVRTRSFNTQRVVSNNVSKHLAYQNRADVDLSCCGSIQMITGGPDDKIMIGS